MKVLILAAGYGTRLYPVVKDDPKALLEVQGKSLVNYIVEKVETLEELTEIILVTNEKFYKTFEQWKEKQPKSSYALTILNDKTESNEDRLGSIGDIDFTLNNMDIDEDLLVIGGDNLFDYSLNDYVSFCRDNSPSVSIGLYDVESLEEATKFGVVEIDEKGKIVSFEEKPEKPKSTLIGMCCYYLPKKSLGQIDQYLLESGKSDRAGDYIKWLCEKNDVYGYKFKGKWYDIGSIESYQEAQKAFA